MNKIIVLFFIVLFSLKPIMAQDNVGIGTTTPQLKALLDLTSTEKGLLVPRMTTAERIAINPAMNDYWGLMVYDVTVNSYYFWDGAVWIGMNDFDPANELDSMDYNPATFMLTFFSAGNITNYDLSGLINDADADPMNELQTISMNAAMDSIFISGGNGIPVASSSTDDQLLSISGDTIFIESGNFVIINDDTLDNDSDPMNEIQTISLNAAMDSIFISGGNGIPVSSSSTDDQLLSINGDTIFIEDGNFVVLTDDTIDGDADSLNEIQTLSINLDTIFLTNGGFVIIPITNDNDSDSTNEIQTLSFNATLDSLVISGGNTVPIPVDADWTVAGVNMYNNNTGNIGIGTVTPNASIHLVGNNGILAVGTFGTGPIIAAGASTRMTWYSRRAAFRAGRVMGVQWDDANTGDYSAAFGLDNTAGGIGSFAAGSGNIATGNYSASVGTGNSSTGANSFSFGTGNDASNTGAFSGGTSTIASGANSVAFGNLSSATGGTSFTGGTSNLSSGFNSLSYGSTNIASGQDAVALGTIDTASGFQSFAGGSNSHAMSDQSFAFGFYAKAYGFRSLAIGVGAEANGQQAIAIGNGAKSTGFNSVTLGQLVRSDGDASIVMGSNANDAGFFGCFVFGDGTLIFPNPVLAATANNQFTARAQGGFRFFTNGMATVGAALPAGANAWVVISDSTKKENFKPVDGEHLLTKISKFNLGTWNYKTQDPSKFRHYGPMAQDFYSAFGRDGIGSIGEPTTIGSADFTGINFIAIQALEKRSTEQAAIIKQQREEIMMLQKALNEVIGRVANLEIGNTNKVKDLSADKK